MTTRTSSAIHVRIDPIGRMLMIDYEPGDQGALFDICDPRGRILKSGRVRGPVTQVTLADVSGDDLILMVLDGEFSDLRPLRLTTSTNDAFGSAARSAA